MEWLNDCMIGMIEWLAWWNDWMIEWLNDGWLNAWNDWQWMCHDVPGTIEGARMNGNDCIVWLNLSCIVWLNDMAPVSVPWWLEAWHGTSECAMHDDCMNDMAPASVPCMTIAWMTWHQWVWNGMIQWWHDRNDWMVGMMKWLNDRVIEWWMVEWLEWLTMNVSWCTWHHRRCQDEWKWLNDWMIEIGMIENDWMIEWLKMEWSKMMEWWENGMIENG